MDKTLIRESQAKKELGVTTEVLHYSRLRLNETSIEEKLQTEIQGFKLGLRLHRYVAKGDKLGMRSQKEREDPDFLCKTFMTSFRITRICGKRQPEWVEINQHRKKVRICQ